MYLQRMIDQTMDMVLVILTAEHMLPLRRLEHLAQRVFIYFLLLQVMIIMMPSWLHLSILREGGREAGGWGRERDSQSLKHATPSVRIHYRHACLAT